MPSSSLSYCQTSSYELNLGIIAEMQLVSSGTDWTFEPYGTQSAFYLIIRYRSIITSLLHASPRVSTRAVRVERAKSYRGKLRFHVTGRGFSTQRLVAFHDTWHFHETSHGISMRPVTVESRVEFSRVQ